jgi:hypothetical protein
MMNSRTTPCIVGAVVVLTVIGIAAVHFRGAPIADETAAAPNRRTEVTPQPHSSDPFPKGDKLDNGARNTGSTGATATVTPAPVTNTAVKPATPPPR